MTTPRIIRLIDARDAARPLVGAELHRDFPADLLDLACFDWGTIMNHTSDELYRKALEAEDGQLVSAGARVAHVRDAIASGRAFLADLSAVPQDRRPALIAELNELVRRASESAA